MYARKKILGFLLINLLLGLVSCKSNQSVTKWKLCWKENFNSSNNLNPKIWSKIPRGKSDWNNYMSDFDSCYIFKKGNLILRGIKNYSLPNDTASYLTGGVYTKNKKDFSNGRIEIRARLYNAQGAWPAIWMLPQNAKWPMGGEIDIMEHLNNDSIVYQTVHSYYTHQLNIKDNPPSHSTSTIIPGKYNIYAVEMYPDSLSFFVNNKHTFTYPRIKTTQEDQFPFTDQPFYLLIDMQLGGNWVGKVNPEELPVEMHIDWVRFYERKKK